MYQGSQSTGYVFFVQLSLSDKTFPLFYVYISPGFYLVSYFICVISELSGDTSHLLMLTRTIAANLCIYHVQHCLFHMMYYLTFRLL